MTGIICALPLIASLFSSCDIPPPLAVGYVEGEYVLIAPIEVAEIVELHVWRGQSIEADQPLVRLERRDAEIAVAETVAILAEANSKLADLQDGKRPEEIAVIAAALNSAKAQAGEAERILSRQEQLLARGITAQAAFDDARTGVDMADAKVAELEASLAVAKLPARPDTIRSAQAGVDRAVALLEQARWRLSRRTLSAPRPGTVVDIIRNPGDIAGPQAPVISVLPDGAVKLRLYLAQSDLARISIGTALHVRCDGCGSEMTADVTYIASDPEFTPPVIYSLENRQKLVYLVEARPGDSARALKPGQIVDVILAAGTP
ncbi:MAG: HlyD family secretion protein [Alphaproteobacteria bacterium]